MNFHFELRLLILISLAHHREPFIRDTPCHNVLIDADKQEVKFRQPFFGLCQTLSVSTDGFLAGQAELLLHDLPEVLLIPCHIENDRFHVHPDQIFQNNRPDEVSRTASRVAAVVRAYKVILPLLKVVGGAVPHFRSAVGTVDHAREQTTFARFRSAVTLLPDLLHLVKDFLLDDRRMGVVENRLIFKGRFPLLLVPDRIGVGLEVDRTACVFPAFQNLDHGIAVPSARIFWQRIGTVDAFAVFVGSRSQHSIFSQLIGNLRRSSSVHAHLKDTLHNSGSFRINDPLLRILRVFHISVRHIGCQRYATLTLGFCHGSDFSAGVTGIKLIEPILDACKIIIHAVEIRRIEIVIDGDIANTQLRECEIGIEIGVCRVSAKTGEVFGDTVCHSSCFHLCKHCLKTGSVKYQGGITILPQSQ